MYHGQVAQHNLRLRPRLRLRPQASRARSARMEGPSAFDLSRWPHFILTAYRNAGWPAYATTFLSALCGVALTTAWAASSELRLPSSALYCR